MKTIVDNLAIEYADEGAGPVVLMLHGWKDTLRTFDLLAPRLAVRHRVVRLDLPGFGASDAPRSDWHLSDYVDFVQAFIDKLELDVGVLVGHSLGGRIAIKGVATKVLRPQKLVLIAAAGIAKRRTLKNEMLRATAKIGKGVTTIPPFSFWRQSLRRKLYEGIGSDYFASGALKGTFLNIIGEDLSAVASSIRMPTLLIWGRDDESTPLSDGERLHAMIPGSALRAMDGAGHFVHRERPHEVLEAIEQFV